MEDALGGLSAAEPVTPDPPPPDVRERAPGVREVTGRSLDLALASSGRIRKASVYFGLLTLALAGPAAILLLALARHLGSLEDAIALVADGYGFGDAGLVDPSALGMLRLCMFGAVVGLFALAVEAQIVAATILGGVAIRRQIGLRDSLRVSRAVFWQVVGGSILVGILRLAVDVMTAALLHPNSLGSLQSAQVWQLIIETVVTAPFAFFIAGIVIGGVGAIESLRRSTPIARARWRLALLVAATGVAGAFIQDFALGAGLDLLARVGTTAGLGLYGAAHVAVLTVLVVLVAIVAIGSLVVTVSALIVAPQVVVFLGMTGYTAGLDRATTASGGYRWISPTRLVTWPMIVLIVFGGLAALVGLASI
jgi:hypothetical protein